MIAMNHRGVPDCVAQFSSVVLTDENLAFGASVFDRFHRIDAARDQATRPASYDAKDESEDPGGRAGIRSGRRLDRVVAVGTVVLLGIGSEDGSLLNHDLWRSRHDDDGR